MKNKSKYLQQFREKFSAYGYLNGNVEDLEAFLSQVIDEVEVESYKKGFIDGQLEEFKMKKI